LTSKVRSQIVIMFWCFSSLEQSC